MANKRAVTDFPILDCLALRWSPYAFRDKPVSAIDLAALFEAARWAPSSYNEQPWTYLVATRDNPAEFQNMLSCLVEANQTWCKFVPVLALGVVKLRFAHNNKENRAAFHDLGLASGNLLAEATARGIAVHQMIGIIPARARELYHIPPEHEAWTALAIGYKGPNPALPAALLERDAAPRTRKLRRDFVFSGTWGKPF
jgi:nitroreductase